MFLFYQPSTLENLHNSLENILKTCPFIISDNHKWNEITEKDIKEYYLKFENINYID